MNKTYIFGAIVLLILISGCSNNFKDIVDYCEQDSDCVWEHDCCSIYPVNKFHVSDGAGAYCQMVCDREFMETYHERINKPLKCVENKCVEVDTKLNQVTESSNEQIIAFVGE